MVSENRWATLPLTLLLHNINASVHQILELQIRLILGVHCPQVEGEILWHEEGRRKIKHESQYAYLEEHNSENLSTYIVN